MRKQKKLDNKAWLRIVEAFLAVIIILGAVLFILAKQPPARDISENVYETQRQILDVISKNDSLRQVIVDLNVDDDEDSSDDATINGAIQNLIPSSWEFSTRVCGLDDICSNPGEYQDTDVYSTEVVVTSTLEDYSPRKLRFFVWMK